MALDRLSRARGDEEASAESEPLTWHEIRDTYSSNVVPPFWVRHGRALAAAVALGLVASVTIAAFGWTPAELIAAGFAAGALVFAAMQWRASTAEKSLDTLYDRIDLANQRRLDWSAARHDSGAHKRELYLYFVFTELDNLEYSIQKYRRGFVGPEVLSRALRMFEQRCRYEPAFCATADHHVEEAAYYGDTREVVHTVAGSCSKEWHGGPPAAAVQPGVAVDYAETPPA